MMRARTRDHAGNGETRVGLLRLVPRGRYRPVLVLGLLASCLGAWPASPPHRAEAAMRPGANRPAEGLHATAITAGYSFAMALDADGNVFAWGQLGGANYGRQSSPDKMQLPKGAPQGFRFTAVAAGGGGAVGVGTDGALYIWGLVGLGQLSATHPNTVPLRVPLPARAPRDLRFSAVAAGDSQRLALGSDGVVYALSTSADKQMLSAVPLPTGVAAGFRFMAIAAGSYHDLAMGSDGRLYAWGENSQGELGDGTTTSRTVPTAVHLPAGAGPDLRFTAIAADYDWSLAVDADGHLYSWGAGQGTQIPTAVAVPPGLPAAFRMVGVAAGEATGYALGSDGRIYAWGDGSHGQLGGGVGTSRATLAPIRLPAGAPRTLRFTAVAARVFSAYALGSDGRVYAWGAGGSGQVGDGTLGDHYVPVAVLAHALQAAPDAIQPVTQGPPGSRYFPQTKHSLAGPLLAFWQRYGGLAVLGYPLSEPRSYNGQTVQYTERFALVLTQGAVAPLPLGRLLIASAPIAPPAAAGPTGPSRYFAATGQRLSGSFLAFWQQHRGAVLLGAPISSVGSETNGDGTTRSYPVQWFERGRLEYHPEASAGYRVEIGQLGRQAMRSFGWIP